MMAKKKRKNIVSSDHVMDAITDMEMDFMLPELSKTLAHVEGEAEAKRVARKIDALKKRVAELKEMRKEAPTEKSSEPAASTPQKSKKRGRQSTKKPDPVTIAEIDARLQELQQQLETLLENKKN